MSIVDRYAPSPTSDLHLGNLRTALAGWLLTHRARGSWRLRVEDLDVARVRGFLERGVVDDGEVPAARPGERTTDSEGG